MVPVRTGCPQCKKSIGLLIMVDIQLLDVAAKDSWESADSYANLFTYERCATA